jgi:hypothetical protein
MNVCCTSLNCPLLTNKYHYTIYLMSIFAYTRQDNIVEFMHQTVYVSCFPGYSNLHLRGYAVLLVISKHRLIVMFVLVAPCSSVFQYFSKLAENVAIPH